MQFAQPNRFVQSTRSFSASILLPSLEQLFLAIRYAPALSYSHCSKNLYDQFLNVHSLYLLRGHPLYCLQRTATTLTTTNYRRSPSILINLSGPIAFSASSYFCNILVMQKVSEYVTFSFFIPLWPNYSQLSISNTYIIPNISVFGSIFTSFTARISIKPCTSSRIWYCGSFFIQIILGNYIQRIHIRFDSGSIAPCETIAILLTS